jgi:hypothetical protein
MFDSDPPVPSLELSLTSEALRLAAINGRFGRTESFQPKPENIFFSLPLLRPALAEYRDNDPDAIHYRPYNISEYKNSPEGALMLWSLRVYDIDTGNAVTSFG